MKALSIRQPWAWLIVNAYKDVENRSWRLAPQMMGQRIYVHAGLRVQWDTSWAWILGRLQETHPDGASPFWQVWRAGDFPTGSLVGEVTLVQDVTKHPSPWFEGPHGFLLRDAKAYEMPIQYKGALGFFEVKP